MVLFSCKLGSNKHNAPHYYFCNAIDNTKPNKKRTKIFFISINKLIEIFLLADTDTENHEELVDSPVRADGGGLRPAVPQPVRELQHRRDHPEREDLARVLQVCHGQGALYQRWEELQT